MKVKHYTDLHYTHDESFGWVINSLTYSAFLPIGRWIPVENEVEGVTPLQ